MNRVWLKVVKARMEEAGGVSIFNPYLTLGNIWELTLEDGRVVHRRPRYKPLPKGSYRRGWQHRRSSEDALPPPKRVLEFIED